MPRKKRPVPDQKWVNPVAKMKRGAQIGDKPRSAKPKPRVKVGSPEAAKLGIK